MNTNKQARDLAELGFLQQYFKEAGLESEVIDPSEEVPIGTLLVPLTKDSQQRDRYLTFNFVPSLAHEGIEHIRLLQIYTQIPVSLVDGSLEKLEKLLLAINCHLAIGHYSIRENQELHYRYVWCTSSGHLIPKEQILEITDLFILMLDTFGGMIDSVASGQTELSEALAFLEQ
ncbi:hypothetical protein [Paenibacillus agricola]|uniref:Sensory transduction regulator n=1 Tax=Paenibacillus agricola TaxID=2716264 RepID=A0ABX0J2E2_9BACL|nr:hypothetical protein [Paenibacillus agricola]NHN30517.1 hypothetical protein [Paenibacillus agricola]